MSSKPRQTLLFLAIGANIIEVRNDLAVFTFIILFPTLGYCAFGNFNSILIGQQAAGVGGAYTALTEDSSAVSFYNPAAMTRMKGASISASVSAYQKLDTEFGQSKGFLKTPRRINDGFFEPVPSSAGSVVSFGHFALGLSVIIPDYNTFTGEIESSEDVISFLSFTDESLWVGGSFALNLSDETSVGLTAYYTARRFIRSVSDQLLVGSDATVTIEEKSFTNNSLIYILGLYHEFNPHFSAGLSLRFPSIEITGRGTYFNSLINTSPANVTQTNDTGLNSNTKIPGRLAAGVAYKQEKKYTLSADVTYYTPTHYQDLELDGAGDLISHQATWNFALGGEYYYNSWLTLRGGVFSNYSSHEKITSTADGRVGDNIDMFGFSANLTFHTSNHTVFTFGGYWTGGEGTSVQQVGQQLKIVDRTFNSFTMLIGSAYNF